MKPGIYEGLPFADYLAIDALSNTAMGALARSPRHFRYGVIDSEQKHFKIGSVVHAGRLEPMNLPLIYAVEPSYHLDEENCTDAGKNSTSKATRYVKEKKASFADANQDKEIVPAEWFNECKSIVESLCQDELANHLLNKPGPTELTLVWEDDETGILCKARYDKLCSPSFVDLKTCANLESFTKSIHRYGYYRQMAHYQAGYIALTGEILAPWMVAIEKQPPYCVQSAPLCEEAVELGQRERRRLINLYAECLENDHWPGPESPSAWRLPEWAYDDGESIELTINGETVTL